MTSEEVSLFPYEHVRDIQKDLIKDVGNCVKNGIHMIAHAPTGLGKTVAALAPALRNAIDKNRVVFFLTSRHTQHHIAIETLRAIKEKHQIDLHSVDLIGKQHMCSAPGVSTLYGGEFFEYCKKQREEGKCEFFNNTKKSNKLTPEAKLTLEVLKNKSPLHTEEFKEICEASSLCSYEMAIAMATESKVIVADYYYIFNPSIASNFFRKIDRSLGEVIVIVDEAHNLPDRIRNLMTTQVTTSALMKAGKEAEKFASESVDDLAELGRILEGLSAGMSVGEERMVRRDDFSQKISKDYELLIDEFNRAAEAVREKENQSTISSIVRFLEAWQGGDEAYVRIISKKRFRNKTSSVLSYRCLDPALLTKDTIKNCHSVILMSGTLRPTGMYKDILGFPDRTMEREYESPFPQENRINLVIPETTTKYSLRNEDQYRRMAEICADVTNKVRGNCAVFFPSYFLRDQVYRFFDELSEKTAFLEESGMTKEEKSEFLERFKGYKAVGAVLLGAMTGSYGEGIDLPGDLLNCVIIVGLPLQKPNIEVKSLIEYYDKKFGKGWDYGYVYPAFQKTLQSAGRCIRSETDRGVIVFLDERYAWSNYHKNFPKDWRIIVTRDYDKAIDYFFEN